MILQANGIHRKVGVAFLKDNKINFKITKVTRNKDGHFIKKTWNFLIDIHPIREH